MNNGHSNDQIGESRFRVQYDFTRTISWRAEWLRYINSPTGLTNTTVAIDSYSLGIVFKF